MAPTDKKTYPDLSGRQNTDSDTKMAQEIALYKILIIEDDKEIRTSLRLLLETEGFVVSEAANGDDGLELISSDTDLIILDIMMPGKSGFEVCRTIRKNSTIPVLFLPALGEEDIVDGLTSGGDDYIIKPFSANELIARIRAMIRRNQFYQTSARKA